MDSHLRNLFRAAAHNLDLDRAREYFVTVARTGAVPFQLPLPLGFAEAWRPSDGPEKAYLIELAEMWFQHLPPLPFNAADAVDLKMLHLGNLRRAPDRIREAFRTSPNPEINAYLEDVGFSSPIIAKPHHFYYDDTEKAGRWAMILEPSFEPLDQNQLQDACQHLLGYPTRLPREDFELYIYGRRFVSIETNGKIFPHTYGRKIPPHTTHYGNFVAWDLVPKIDHRETD